MANKVIGQYSAASTIDGATHFLLIQPGNSSTAYNSINRNTFLGVTGQPMDISTAQTVTNKILDNTNSITVKDGSFTLQDDADTTKQAQFQLSGNTTGTRIYSLPNATGTLADLATAQTFTNKTLTSPVITGGSITGSTITTDAIIGQTVATNGTVYGVSITGGKINGGAITANTIGSTALATNAVQASQLATNAITLGYAQITANTTTASATAVQITGLTATVTIPAGGRRVKITVFIPNSSNTVVSTASYSIWDGTVGSGTQLAESRQTHPLASGTNMSIMLAAVVTPAAGSKTYNAGVRVDAGTETNIASATAPPFILVEAI